MIDKLFLVVIVLNATGLFKFLAPQMNVSIGQVSLCLLGVTLFYLFVKLRSTSQVLLSDGLGSWLIVLLLWPLSTLTYAPSFEMREVGLQLYFSVLFCGVLVYTVCNGAPGIRRVLHASLTITVFGLFLSMVAPQYFTAVAELAEATGFEKETRACGFFLQPNSLAQAMGILFIGWFALMGHKNTLFQVVSILGFLVLMLLTGSRTGVLVAVIATAFILAPSWKTRIARGKYCMTVIVLVVCLAGGVIGMRNYVFRLDRMDVRRTDLLNRMQTMLSFKLSDDGSIGDDGSVRTRLGAQALYWSLIKEKPLLGHGFGSDAYYLQIGYIPLSAHSQALACAMECGVLYPLAFVLLLIQMYRRRARNDVGVFPRNTVGQFTVILLFFFIVNGNLFEGRTFFVVLAIFVATTYCPQMLLKCDSESRVCQSASYSRWPMARGTTRMVHMAASVACAHVKRVLA